MQRPKRRFANCWRNRAELLCGGGAFTVDDARSACEHASIEIDEVLQRPMRAPNHLNALRAFEAVGRHLSYVAAAEELHVTPAAIGQMIRGLEETLEVELFHRSTSGASRLVLTDAARAAMPELQAGFELLATAVERLKAGKERITVTVTVPPALADKWFLHRVERFQRNFSISAIASCVM